VTRLLDSNVLLRHLTGEPPEHAARAMAALRAAADRSLLLLDLHVGELIYVLDTVYERPRAEIATLLRAVLSLSAIVVDDVGLIRRALELYELRRMDWADAYLVATGEQRDIAAILSFDRFDAKLVGLSVHREEPS
jgi:predicted nucleic-acid-binding protein